MSVNRTVDRLLYSSMDLTPGCSMEILTVFEGHRLLRVDEIGR